MPTQGGLVVSGISLNQQNISRVPDPNGNAPLTSRLNSHGNVHPPTLRFGMDVGDILDLGDILNNTPTPDGPTIDITETTTVIPNGTDLPTEAPLNASDAAAIISNTGTEPASTAKSYWQQVKDWWNGSGNKAADNHSTCSHSHHAHDIPVILPPLVSVGETTEPNTTNTSKSQSSEKPEETEEVKAPPKKFYQRWWAQAKTWWNKVAPFQRIKNGFKDGFKRLLHPGLLNASLWSLATLVISLVPPFHPLMLTIPAFFCTSLTFDFAMGFVAGVSKDPHPTTETHPT